MKKLLYSLLVISASAGLYSCRPDLRTDPVGSGSLDFSRYLAVGNSLTAGYSDAALTRSGQLSSYPRILAMQFGIAGGPGVDSFRIPLLFGDNGLSISGGRRVLGPTTNCLGVTSLGPTVSSTPLDVRDTARVNGDGPFNAVAVPGIRAIDFLFPGYANLNPFARRFFNTPAARPLDEVKRYKNPSFFSLWIGNNDVLLYALSGGSGSTAGTGLDQNAISALPLFQAAYDSVLNVLTANKGTEGVLLTIPDITSIPFFTTIPPNALTLDAATAAQLTLAYTGTGINFSAGNNYFVIQDTSIPIVQRRQLRPGELVLLSVPQDSIKCGGWGSIRPIPMRYVLDAREIAAVNAATFSFNSHIRQRAAERSLALVDAGAYLRTIQAGIIFNGVTYNPTFVTGGTFSLDGVHLTPRGYALLSNEIIRTINGFYGSAVPQVDVNRYNGVLFP